MTNWRPLIYKDYNLGDTFEYSEIGLIRRKSNQKISKQKGDCVILNYYGDLIRINIPFLLTGEYPSENKPRKDKGQKRKPQYTLEFLEKQMRKIAKEEFIKLMGKQ